MSSPARQLSTTATGRRIDHRYAISAKLRYELRRDSILLNAGQGQTVNLSSSGVLFESEYALPPGMQIELWIAWPVRLNNTTALNLHVIGRTVRAHDNRTAVKFLRHVFRIASPSKQRHLIPKPTLPDTFWSASSDLPGIRRALAAARHLLVMYRRQLDDEKSRHRLQRLENRLMAVASELDQFGTFGKCSSTAGKDAGSSARLRARTSADAATCA